MTDAKKTIKVMAKFKAGGLSSTPVSKTQVEIRVIDKLLIDLVI